MFAQVKDGHEAVYMDRMRQKSAVPRRNYTSRFFEYVISVAHSMDVWTGNVLDRKI